MHMGPRGGRRPIVKWKPETMLTHVSTGRVVFAQPDSAWVHVVPHGQRKGKPNRDEQVIRVQETGEYEIVSKFALRRAVLTFQALS